MDSKKAKTFTAGNNPLIPVYESLPETQRYRALLHMMRHFGMEPMMVLSVEDAFEKAALAETELNSPHGVFLYNEIYRQTGESPKYDSMTMSFAYSRLKKNVQQLSKEWFEPLLKSGEFSPWTDETVSFFEDVCTLFVARATEKFIDENR